MQTLTVGTCLKDSNGFIASNLNFQGYNLLKFI